MNLTTPSGEVSNEDMHSFDPTREIANSSICIFPRVKFSSHDPVVHHSGHDVKRRVEVNVPMIGQFISSSEERNSGQSTSLLVTSLCPFLLNGDHHLGLQSSRINLSDAITSTFTSIRVDKIRY
ncbi:hypothetical protein Tco_1047695 [Tanacetum coccineum]